MRERGIDVKLGQMQDEIIQPGYTYVAYLYTIDSKVYITKTSIDKLFSNIFKILNDNYSLIPIKEGIYEIKYKP